MNITTATPAQIDAEIARIDAEIATANAQFMAAFAVKERNKINENDRIFGERARAAIDKAEADMATIDARRVRLFAEQEPFINEFGRRGGWTRYFLVDNTNGHVHLGTSCSTCFPTTSYRWLTSESGKTAEDVVELAGERACTTCFPWAPVEVLDRPTAFRTTSEQSAADKRAERAQKANATAAKKAAAAITDVDGTPLKDEHGYKVETEREAQSKYTDAAAMVLNYADEDDTALYQPQHMTVSEYWDNVAERREAEQRVAERMLAALAAKRGTTVEEQRAELTKKVAAKARTFRKEAAAMRARNRHVFI